MRRVEGMMTPARRAQSLVGAALNRLHHGLPWCQFGRSSYRLFCSFKIEAAVGQLLECARRVVWRGEASGVFLLFEQPGAAPRAVAAFTLAVSAYNRNNAPDFRTLAAPQSGDLTF